jgi:glycerate kinase
MNTNVLIAPNAFKHSLSAPEAAKAIQLGFEQAEWKGLLRSFPIGDGGTGTGSLLAAALKATLIKTPVENLLGVIELVEWGWCAEQELAIIDLSAANGLHKITDEQKDPLHLTTYGTGQLIKAALQKKAKEILLCVGGSATIDGGIGIAQALGVKFIDHRGNEISTPVDLIHLAEIDKSGADKQLQNCSLKVLCDVNTTFLGAQNAIEVYGPQKGADTGMQNLLIRSFKKYNSLLEYYGYESIAGIEKGGAAGGVAAGMKTLFNAQLVDGFETFYTYTGLDKQMPEFQILITGEGKLDNQTLEGKGPYAIARKAQHFNIKTVVVAGVIQEDFNIDNSPFYSAYDIISNFKNGNDFSQTPHFLTELAKRIANDLKDHLWKH